MTDWVIRLIDGGGYWGIAFLMFLENVFPPIPSELIMGLGGIRVGQGQMAMMPLLIYGTVGTTLGNYVWYLVGRLLGFRRLKPLVDRYGRWATIEWSHVEQINRLFTRYGQAIVFLFRFMPTFRTMVSLPAGLFRMGHVRPHAHGDAKGEWRMEISASIRFLLFTAAGALIWNVILAYGGYYLGQRITHIDRYLGPVTTGCVMLLVAIYVYRLITWRPTGGGRD